MQSWSDRRSRTGPGTGLCNTSCDPSSYTDLVFFLTSTPQLAFFIHSLTLWGNPPEADVLAVAPMEVEVLNGILSALPSLRTLCLHNVKFTSSNIAVPYRYDSINRLILSSTTQPYDVMKPLAFFSHIHELELELARSWERPALTPLSFEEICLWWHISNIVPTHVQVSSIHLKGPFYRPILEMFRRTRTPHPRLRSFSIHNTDIINYCYPSSSLLDFLCESAPILTHITLGTGYPSPFQIGRAYHEFDSQEMRTRLAPLTSLLSLTLKVYSETMGLSATNIELLTCQETFARMMPLLASFPPSLRRITFSFAHPKPWVHSRFTGASWLSPDLDLRPLVPLLQRYKQLEIIAFEGNDDMKVEEKERVLNDLLELRNLIRFVDGRESETCIRESLIVYDANQHILRFLQEYQCEPSLTRGPDDAMG